MEARKVEANHGWLWIKQGIGLYKKSPLMWVVLAMLATISMVSIASIPVVGDPLATLLIPVAMAGFMIGSRALQSGEELELAHLFAGFRHQAPSLVTLGGVNLVSQMIIMWVMKMMGAEELVDLIMGGKPIEDPEILAHALEGAGGAMMVGMSLYFVLVMAMQFAPALVLFKQASPVEALNGSLKACLANLMPLSVYGAVMLLLALLATMPMMLGWLILLPVMIATIYTAYCDLFPAQPNLVTSEHIVSSTTPQD